MISILPKSIRALIESFQKLPGIGPKTASRLAFYLLHVPQNQLDQFADALKNLKTHTVYCSVCFNTGESDPCVVCADAGRDTSMVCVVEQPIDIVNLEKTGKFRGRYHVLHGAIDPLNNIGPDEIRIAELAKRVAAGGVKEVIIATDPDMEGEATAMYIKRELNTLIETDRPENKVAITRLANGLPVGADVEYADEVTLSRAMEGRREY